MFVSITVKIVMCRTWRVTVPKGTRGNTLLAPVPLPRVNCGRQFATYLSESGRRSKYAKKLAKKLIVPIWPLDFHQTCPCFFEVLGDSSGFVRYSTYIYLFSHTPTFFPQRLLLKMMVTCRHGACTAQSTWCVLSRCTEEFCP